MEKNEQPSTYFVQDRSNQQELERLVFQDHIITTAMGGVLSELPHPEQFQRILDVGCGTGDWLREAAMAYPTISSLIGVDISNKMLDYARIQAAALHIDDRVEFLVMDALRMLEFPDRFFDLVNLRFGQSFLRTWDWHKLLQEFKRVTKPGGTIRLADTIFGEPVESPALAELNALSYQAFKQAGHAIPDILKTLPDLLEKHGFTDVQTHLYEPVFIANTAEGQMFVEDIVRAFRTVLPFLHKWIKVPENYEELYGQLLEEAHQPGFSVRWPIFTIWATRL